MSCGENLIDSAPATDGSKVYFNPGTALQRPGLTILDGVVYVAYGAYGNTNPYNGWILGFSESSLALTSVFCVTPNENPPYTSSQSKGSIWQSGVEITTDGTYLYAVTGNGIVNSNATVGDYGEIGSETAFALTPTLRKLPPRALRPTGMGFTSPINVSNT